MAKPTASIEVHIILSAQQAFWLKAAMQNPHPDDEGELERNIRESIFNALPPFKALES